MAAWLVPALKAVLPHLGSIIAATAPVFTRNRPEASANEQELLKRQIGELQAAAAQNTAHVKDLAAQLQATIAALEDAAAEANQRLRRAQLACLLAIALSAASLLFAIFA